MNLAKTIYSLAAVLLLWFLIPVFYDWIPFEPAGALVVFGLSLLFFGRRS